MRFSIARLPRLEFGSGAIRHLPRHIRTFRGKALILTGARSFVSTPHWSTLQQDLAEHGIAFTHICCSGKEPSPEDVDQKVRDLQDEEFSVVVGIGGGSVLDEAKAVAGLLPSGTSVMDYLEGVGPELPYVGPSIPFIAVPTTAGTGSEATKNAVLSRHGPNGFKKSFRDDQLVAEWAVVDPDLLSSCPPQVLAGNGMDAFTQLLESYVSLNANPFTDALAKQGMAACRDGLLPLYESGGKDAQAREKMALASYLSGVTLAQTGLGSVHGLASPLGAFFPIPHGIVCGTLLTAATQVNLKALAARNMMEGDAARKYAQAGRILANSPELDAAQAHEKLLEILEHWSQQMPLPRLSHYKVQPEDFARIVANSRGSSMKTNPVVLEDPEIQEILAQRL